MTENVYRPGPSPTTLMTADGEVVTPPLGWILVPPGEPVLTRRVKATGPFWLVQEKVGGKLFERGVWAEKATVDALHKELKAERATESVARREADARRPAGGGDFQGAVLAFLDFHPDHTALAERLARAVIDHASPVARTEGSSLETRAEAAVIAWMRHQTTGYDDLTISRDKGERRAMRRMLAQRSEQLLWPYRRGDGVGPDCPLQLAVERGWPQGLGGGPPSMRVRSDGNDLAGSPPG